MTPLDAAIYVITVVGWLVALAVGLGLGLTTAFMVFIGLPCLVLEWVMEKLSDLTDGW